MVNYSNLAFILKVLNLKCFTYVEDETILKLKHSRKCFLWDRFFNQLSGTTTCKTLHYPSKDFKNYNEYFKKFCDENNTKIIVHGKTVYDDYEIVGLKFYSIKQKTFFILKYGNLIQECIKR